MDRIFDIATGPSRSTKHWQNQRVTWEALLERLLSTVRTGETVAEYAAMPRERQAEIKDQGGFVGGFLAGGLRSAVEHRSILCLDADYANRDMWIDWGLSYGCTAAVYSTHKHTPEAPRFRLVIPLARDVSGEEYQAIGRRIAETLGIDLFDDSTYDPGRLMYWPSTPRDGEFYAQRCDGDLLDPDEVLATYHDWHDVSSWPVSSRVAGLAHKASASKQSDPLAKRGLIGAFCRAYTIQEAIAAFVPDYTPAGDGRYTYTKGSTSGGVVIYDDRFAYSHHATDPASGQLCNAWDLVRIHLYGGLDDKCGYDTPSSQRPSYKAMCDMAAQDKAVAALRVQDRMAQADADFLTPLVEPTDWTRLLDMTEKGLPKQTLNNVIIIMRSDSSLSGCFAFNELSSDIMVRRDPPWPSEDGATAPRELRNSDLAQLRALLDARYGMTIGHDKITDALRCVAVDHRHHPIRDYLERLTWDGTPRLDRLLVTYLGAEDSEYTRAVTRKTLVAAVTRVYRPGTKFDTCLTIQAEQGIGKSTLIARLGGPWYTDTVDISDAKTQAESLSGKWIIELGELDALRRAEVGHVRLFLSKTSDRARAAYAERVEEHPRQCVFFGSVNEPQFLRDSTGGRRFWVVRCPNSHARQWTEALAALDQETVDQIWAEAKAVYDGGKESLYLPPALDRIAEAVQESVREEDPLAGVIADYLDRALPDNWEAMGTYDRRAWLGSDAVGTVRRQFVCSREITLEALDAVADRVPGRDNTRQINAIMARMPGWKSSCGKVRRFGPYGNQRYYERVSADE